MKKKPVTRRVTFVGGPACGAVRRMRVSDMATYIGLVIRPHQKEYLYRHQYRHKVSASAPLKVLHRYVFQGHRAALPKESD